MASQSLSHSLPWPYVFNTAEKPIVLKIQPTNPARLPPTGNPHLILFTLALLVFAVASQVMIVAPILTRISEQLGVETAVLGTLITAYALAVGVFALISGPISDRIGRRKVLLAGAGLMTMALALHGLALNFTLLLVFRTLAGAAGGILSGAAVAYVGDYFPRDRRGWANGWIMSDMAAGQIAGIPAGTLLAGYAGFQTPFLAFAVLMGLALILVWWAVPQPDVPRAPDKLTLRTAFDSYRTLLRRREVVAAAVAFFVMFGSIALYILYLPTWLEHTLGFGSVAIASLYFVGGSANVIAGPQAGKLSDRLGRKKVIIWTSFGIAFMMFITPLSPAASWLIYGVFFLMMAFFASRASPFQALMTELVSSEQRGSLMSLTLAIGQGGFGLGSAVAGFLYMQVGFAISTILAAFTTLVMAAVVWFFLPETKAQTSGVASDPLDTSMPKRVQSALCGPCPEAGHMIRVIQHQCDQGKVHPIAPGNGSTETQ